MPSFESAFKIVSGLVKDFKGNEKFYTSPQYSEADVRNDFINKFFIALGWDLRHEQQKNPYEQEVRVEKPVLVAKAQKRADYTFYLSPNFRDVKFFVEAKKPYHDLDNKDYFFQTVRYGWNANTPIAVLTDFEEFVILDCRYRPDINDILNYKIKNFHYSDYTNEDKFKEIYYLFSREAVASQSIEKYSDNLPKPKGKGIKKGTFTGNFQSIDESFLNELDEIRTDLAKSFKKNNSHLTSDELTEATQRTIDRLVFIKFLEDRLIEPHHYISEFGKRRSAWEDFTTASLTLDAKYNGVVFKKSKIDSRNIIEPDDKIFSKICEDLSHENTPYNFDAIPIHILGSIYERFLGKVVNATDKRVTIEEKPEVRKAGGVYYTPQYIVNYIVNNTIGKLIEGKTPKEISKMRFADIACGSGSFLITVYEILLDHHKHWYIDNPEKAKKDGCILYEGVYRLSLQQKQKILTNNIYGVDLDNQAVEVTQLSLYLKLLEDETTATANDTWVMFKEKLLPDLNKNIICGNSLVGTDILEGNLFDYGEEKKLKPMDFENEFPGIIENGGFDAVIGNPPYVFTRDVDWGEKVKDHFWKNFDIKKNKSESSRKDQSGKINLYILFLLKATQLIKTNGKVSYILPNGILRTTTYDTTRRYILEDTSINEIVDLKSGVFKGVTASTIIITLSKYVKNNKIKIIYADYKNNILIENAEYQTMDQKKMLSNVSYAINIFANDELINIFEKMNASNNYLKDISKDIIEGIVSSKKYITTEQINGKYKPFLEGKDIKRFEIRFCSRYILFDRKKLHRARPDYVWEAKEKIIIQRISGGVKPLVAALDTENYYSFASTNLLLINEESKSNYSYELICALLNSKLINLYYSMNFTNGSSLTVNISKTFLEMLPLPMIDEGLFAKTSALIPLIMKSKALLLQSKTEGEKDYLERKCESLDKQIDELVFKLYNLTEEEIKLVEESLDK